MINLTDQEDHFVEQVDRQNTIHVVCQDAFLSPLLYPAPRDPWEKSGDVTKSLSLHYHAEHYVESIPAVAFP